MESFLKAVKPAVSHALDAFNTLIAAVEYIAFRLALLWFFLYGIYQTMKSP